MLRDRKPVGQGGNNGARVAERLIGEDFRGGLCVCEDRDTHPGRVPEQSIRLALGAGPGRLSRQLVTETLLLAAAGTLLGLLLASWTGNLLPALIPKIHAPISAGFQMNNRVLGFTLLTCILAALVSSAAPALLWFRSDVNETLKEGGRGGSQGADSRRLHGVLVVSEVALATLALVGAGLFLRSFQNARTIHPGFDQKNVQLVRFYLGSTGFTTRDKQQFAIRLRDRLRSDPGVIGVTYADYPPLGASAGALFDHSSGGLWASAGRIHANQSVSGCAGLLRHAANSTSGRSGFRGERRI